MNGYLLDSDWIVDFLKGRPETTAHVATLGASSLYLSVISYAEVFEGLFDSPRPEPERAAFQTLLKLVTILPVDIAIGERFAELRRQLRKSGRPLDNFDLLIASTALCGDLVLLTRNSAHFDRVPDLVVNQF